MAIYKRGKRYYINIEIGGKRIHKSTGTADLELARRCEQKAVKELFEAEKLGDKGCKLWDDVAARYLSEAVGNRKRDAAIIKWLSHPERLGAVRIKDINAEVIEAVRIKRLEKCCHATVNREMNTVRAVLNSCVKWEYLTRIPSIPMYRLPEREPTYLTREQYAQLRQHLPHHLALAADVAVYTGLRMRAMGQLTWDRIDLDKGRGWIPAAQMKGGHAHGFPLIAETVAALKELKQLNPGDNVYLPRDKGRNVYVFRWNGERIDNFNTKAFKSAAKAIGVPQLRWHDLRHTFASWAAQAGVSMSELMALGGWRSWQMVQRYAHLSPDHLASAASKISTLAATTGSNSRHMDTHTVAANDAKAA